MDKESKKLMEDIKKAFQGHTDSVVDTIRVTVNGKIDKLNNTVKQWIEDETGKREAIEKKLDDYIKTTEPMIEFFDDITSSKKVLFYLLSTLGTIGAFYLMVKEIFK